MDSPEFVEVTGLKRRVCVAINGKNWALNTHLHTSTHIPMGSVQIKKDLV